jgi:hypothetical protein
LFGSLYKIRTPRIALDVAGHGVKMLVPFHGKRLEAALIKVAREKRAGILSLWKGFLEIVGNGDGRKQSKTFCLCH